MTLIVAALGASTCACAPTVRSASEAAARGAAPAAIDASLNKLEEPQTRQELAIILASPEMKRSVKELSASVTAGVVRGLGSDAMTASMNRLVGELSRSFMAALVSSLLTSPELSAALAKTTREAARQAVLGSNDALAELADKRRRENVGGPLGALDQVFEGRTWLAALLMVGLLLSGPALWFLLELTRIRRALQQGGASAVRDARRALRSRENRGRGRGEGTRGPPRYA